MPAGTRRRRLNYMPDSASDGRQHALSVVLLKASGGPGGIVLLSVGELREDKSRWVSEQTTFVVTSGPRLQRAIASRRALRDREAVHRDLDAQDPGVRAEYERELAFHREEAPLRRMSVIRRAWCAVVLLLKLVGELAPLAWRYFRTFLPGRAKPGSDSR